MYEKKLNEEKALDFDDLLLKTYNILKNNKNVLEKYQNIWKYIHIDEYQDTNKVQYMTTKLLAEKNRNICVVGDVDQSIYSWRGADIQNIFLSSTERIICADYLVKSALPCYVSMRLKLHRKNNSITLPIESIKQDIFNYVNSIPFGESLYVSHIIDICHKYDVKYVELPLVVNGEIYTNAGTTISISDSDILAIPTKLSSGVSSKTTAFFIDYFSLQTPNKLTDSIGIDVY